MLAGPGNVGILSARRRVIAAAGGGGGGGGGISRSGTSDSNHVHTMSSLNTLFMIPNIVYINHPASSNLPGFNDNLENYSVKDINFTSGSNATHTFYLFVKEKHNPSSFNNDLCVGAIQIHSSSAVLFAIGSSTTTVDGTAISTSEQTASTDPTSQTYTTLAQATGASTWKIASSTASSRTGAADSISTDFQNTANPLPEAGDGIIPQVTDTDFLFTETSSPMSLNDFLYLKIVADLATNAAHKFVFAYNFGVRSTDTGDDKDDNVGLYIEN